MTDDQIQEYIEEHWSLIWDHPDDCACNECWEYIAMTQK